MTGYQHILFATDFSNHTRQVAQRAADLARHFKAKLSLLHVVDNLPVSDSIYGPIIPFETDLTDQLLAVAKKRLDVIAHDMAVPEQDRWLEIGSPKHEIPRIAMEIESDLIVVGSHGRHGLSLLLGSTANGVLHHAKCDVLAVRLSEEE